MKQKMRILSLMLAVVLFAVYVMPSFGILHAASLDEYTTVTTFANNNFPVSTGLSQGVDFLTGPEYLTVTTTDAYDPYFTVDLKDTSIKNKIIAIKFKAVADTKIANEWLYPETSAGDWGPSGGGMLSTSDMICDGSWNLATYDVSTQLIGADSSAVGTTAQTSATIYSLRIGGISTKGAVLRVAYVGVFDSKLQLEKYDELYCKTYTSVKVDKPIIIPNAKLTLNTESYDFQESSVTNGLSLIGSTTNINNTWTANRGVGNSAYIVEGNNKYLQLTYDSLKHNDIYSNDTGFYFSADVKPSDKADHFAGFIFNYGYENDWEKNIFYESNKTDGENSVSKSGIGVNIFPSMIIVSVIRYDRDNGCLKNIEYIHTLNKNIGGEFHNFKAIDDANGTIRFLLDGEMFAYVTYSDPGSTPVSASDYYECYYRSAAIYNGDGVLEASTSDALISYIKSFGMGARARSICVDNIKIAALGEIMPSLKLDKTTVLENEDITATINYGDYINDDLYLGIYNAGEECGSGMGKVSASYKVELGTKTVMLPKLMAGSYYAVIMSGNTQCSDKVSFTVADIAQGSDVYAKDAEISVGETVKVPIVLGNNPGLKDLAVKVSWNPAAFKPVSAANGIVMGNAMFSAEKATASYTLTWKGTSKSTATGTLAYVELAANGLTPLGENMISIEIITGDVTAVKGSVKVKDTGLKFKGASLVLSSDLTIRYLVNKSDFDNAGYSEPRMKVFNGGEEKIIEAYEATSGSTVNYVFEYKDIAPQMMNDELSTVLLAKKNGKEVSGSVLKYGVKNYVYSMLDKTTDPTFRTMLVDLLNYGAAAQKYAEYNTGSLVNAELTQEQASWGTKTLRNLKSVIEIVGATDTDAAKWKSMSLKLENKVEMVGKFAAENTDGIYVLVTDDNGNVYGQITSDEFFASQTSSGEEVIGFYFDKLNSTQMSEKLNFVVYNSEGQAISGTCVYSVESYIQKAQSSAEGSLKTLTETIIKYGDAAKKYVEAQGTMFGTKEPVYLGSSFYANIYFKGSYLTLSGSNVVVNEPNGTASQLWKFERNDDGSYEIINLSNNKVLDVDGAADKNSANVQVYTSNGTNAQKWFLYLKDGQYNIRPANSGTRVLDVQGGLTTNGTNVHIYENNGTTAQKFSVVNMTGDPIAFNVTSPYNKPSDKIASFTTLSSAKKFADEKSFLGYVVYTTTGKLAYNPNPNIKVSEILWNAKIVADFARDNGFSYGHASINPAINWATLNPSTAINSKERHVSCDRFVDWALYRAGFTAGQLYTHGHVVFQMDEWLSSSHGFVRINSQSQIRAGDIIFTRWDSTQPGNGAHVFICASSNINGKYYRYDHGADERIWCTKGTEYAPGQQPFFEIITEFCYAYRYNG